MEPFTIQCSTCQSLIRVRNPKMIGQIVNCPKCNSMLQITGPQITGPQIAGPQVANAQPSDTQASDARQIRVESHRGVIDSSAMTKEAFASELEDEYRLAPSQIPEPAMNSSARLVAPPQVDEEPTFGDKLNAPPLPVQKLASSQNGRSATEPNHIQLLAVRRTARRRQVLMVAVLGSSGVLFAGILFTGFLYWYTSKPNTPIAKNSPVQGAGTQKHVGPKREVEQDAFQDPMAEPALDPLSEESPALVEGDPQPPNVTNTISDAITNVIASPNTVQPTNSVGPLTSGESTDPSESSKSTPNGTEQLDTPNSAAEGKPTTELPDQLKKFQNILNTTIEPQFLEDQAIQKAPPTAKELGLSAGHDSKALPAVDVGKQLKLPITGLIVPPGPISNSVSQWVQVSGIPTVVDLDSLVASGVDPNKSLGKILISAEATLAQVGDSLANEIGVESKLIDNHFLAFQASEEAIREHLPTSIKIDDLVDKAGQQWLVKTLEHIWPEYEGKWIVSDGKLNVDPAVVDELAWFWAIRMLESWRLAEGVETQLDKSKLDQSKFVTQFVDPERIPGLNKPLSLTLVNRAPVAQLISEICTASNMHAWVDWASVGQKGLGPNTIDFIVTKDRKLRQCLRDLADKYSLVVACEDDKSVVITTAEVYRAQPRLFVFPSQGKTAEQWMDDLQSLTPATASAAQPVQAYLTPGGEFVIVRCCRPRIRN